MSMIKSMIYFDDTNFTCSSCYTRYLDLRSSIITFIRWSCLIWSALFIEGCLIESTPTIHRLWFPVIKVWLIQSPLIIIFASFLYHRNIVFIQLLLQYVWENARGSWLVVMMSTPLPSWATKSPYGFVSCSA